MNIPLHVLAQTMPSTIVGTSIVSNLFWMTVGLIFFITILSAVLQRVTKDKALKLFHKYHISFLAENRPTTWGDLYVHSQGVELLFDQPYTTRRGIVKSSSLVYEDEFTTMVCMTRSVHGLSAAETAHRKAQIHRTFNPNLAHRSWRWSRNLLNTLRDAISKTLSLVIGRITSTGATTSGAGAVISTQASDINNLTGSVINLAANAYEPLLERYIGKPVVVEIVVPLLPGATPPPVGLANTAEFPGYLVDYTQRFLAVFNVDHQPVETIEITLEKGKPASPELADLTFTLSPFSMVISCVGRDAFVIRKICCAQETSDLGVALIPGTSVILNPIEHATTITVERTRSIDLLVPRTRARIHFGSIPDVHRPAPRRMEWSGVAPKIDNPGTADPVPRSGVSENAGGLGRADA
jgi:hypothetical protein